jgi:predicted nucleic acid-binding protein
MKPPVPVFVDSDVIISSLLSQTGAAYVLFHTTRQIFYYSNYSRKELAIVCRRLSISEAALDKLMRDTFTLIQIKLSQEKLNRKFSSYVFDKNDAHIMAGAVEAKVRFLITYNLKDYKADTVKEEHGVIIMTPARFLQYLRNRA